MALTRSSLIERVRDVADRESWAEFCELYQPFLRIVASREGLLPFDADDLVQDMFLRLREKLPEFNYERSLGRFRAWLKTVTRHAIADWRRKRRRQKEVVLDGAEAVLSMVDGPGDEWDREHHKLILEFALAQVKRTTQPKTWACFEEHMLHARSAADVGPELDLTSNAVFVNACRVLAHVREKCAEHDEDLAEA